MRMAALRTVEQEMKRAQREIQKQEQILLQQFHATLQEISTFRTSYGEIVNFKSGPLAQWALEESTGAIHQAFGKPVADFNEAVPKEAKLTLEQGLYVHEKSAYYIRKLPSGINMMEIRPWSSSANFNLDLVHVPHILIKVNRKYHVLESLGDYRQLMELAFTAEEYETDPKILVNVVTDGEVRKEIESLFKNEWKHIAIVGEETPSKYQLLLDRIDPLFRIRSQPLYARRYNNGLCIAVHRQWNEPAKMSLVVQYIPDAFRFSAEAVRGASGLAGMMYQDYGSPSAQELEGLITTLKGDL